MAKRRGPTRKAARKGGRVAGLASRACKGKRKAAFQACRKAWFRRH